MKLAVIGSRCFSSKEHAAIIFGVLDALIDQYPIAAHESGLPHLAHAMCSIMFAMWTVRHHPGLDDRWKATNEPREAKHYE